MRRERLFVEQVPTRHGVSPENQKVSVIFSHSIGKWCRNPPAAVQRRTALRSGFANGEDVKHLQILQIENNNSGLGALHRSLETASTQRTGISPQITPTYSSIGQRAQHLLPAALALPTGQLGSHCSEWLWRWAPWGLHGWREEDSAPGPVSTQAAASPSTTAVQCLSESQQHFAPSLKCTLTMPYSLGVVEGGMHSHHDAEGHRFALNGSSCVAKPHASSHS